jgi:hypothetical protein
LLNVSKEMIAKDLPSPFELLKQVLSSPSKLALEVLSQLLGKRLFKDYENKSAYNFITNIEKYLRASVKTPENCYLGMFLDVHPIANLLTS